MNDVEFEHTYLNICIDGKVLYESGIFGIYEYMYAYVSDVTLIQKCVSISIVPLVYLFRWLPNRFGYYIIFNYESCKILYINGFDMSKLYFLASAANNYESLNYLLDHTILYKFYQSMSILIVI
jgi:hypothetical protein